VFSYLSYRDPNLLKTLEVYDETAKFLRELDMDDYALTKAIIGTIGDVDAHQLPDAKGYSRYASLCLFKMLLVSTTQLKINDMTYHWWFQSNTCAFIMVDIGAY
jgi:Zn-dependent M16 (insulinase) family peptidase